MRPGVFRSWWGFAGCMIAVAVAWLFLVMLAAGSIRLGRWVVG